MTKIIYYLKLYHILQKGNLKSRFQFISNSITGIIGLTILSITSGLSMYILLGNFSGLDGWLLWQLLFINGLWRVSHGIFLVFGHVTWTISTQVKEGTLDRFLIRPLNPLFQLVTSQVNLSGLGYFFGGGIILIISSIISDKVFSFVDIIFTFITIIIGSIIIFSLFLISGSLSFWIIENKGIETSILNVMTTFYQYPITIYGVVFQFVLSFIIPVAFINYFPSMLLLDVKSEPVFDSVFVYLSPVIALLFFFFAYTLWNIGLNRYNSTGS